MGGSCEKLPRRTFASYNNLRITLGVFDDFSATDLLLGYILDPEFLKDAPQDWILNCCFPPGFPSKTFVTALKRNSLFLQPACIDHHHRPAVLFNN